MQPPPRPRSPQSAELNRAGKQEPLTAIGDYEDALRRDSFPQLTFPQHDSHREGERMSFTVLTRKSMSLFDAVGGWRTVAEAVGSRVVFLVAYLRSRRYSPEAPGARSASPPPCSRRRMHLPVLADPAHPNRTGNSICGPNAATQRHDNSRGSAWGSVGKDEHEPPAGHPRILEEKLK
ncbi:hypothetical protein [Nonomuraea jabiensis]|uniref:hypothetical protein n=1 Tax=Nonomuraea jabiensis TaxID=882448 RepID=UPI003D73D87D